MAWLMGSRDLSGIGCLWSRAYGLGCLRFRLRLFLIVLSGWLPHEGGAESRFEVVVDCSI